MVRRGCLPLLAAALTTACASAPARPKAPEARPNSGSVNELIVLLPDPGTSAVGSAVVSNDQGRVTLDAARESTRVGSGTAPTEPVVLSGAEVSDVFGDLLQTLPPEPRHFTLFFKFESEELTDESRAVVQRVLQEVKARQVPDVVAVGHTDTTGRAQANVQLGLRRATAVRSLLVNAGLNLAAVEVASHGEAELLVKTSDGVFEPRNRRVEITVR